MQVIRETVNAPGCVTSVFHPPPPRTPADWFSGIDRFCAMGIETVPEAFRFRRLMASQPHLSCWRSARHSIIFRIPNRARHLRCRTRLRCSCLLLCKQVRLGFPLLDCSYSSLGAQDRRSSLESVMGPCVESPRLVQPRARSALCSCHAAKRKHLTASSKRHSKVAANV